MRVIGAVVGLAPHVLHHIGLLAGTALIAGAGTVRSRGSGTMARRSNRPGIHPVVGPEHRSWAKTEGDRR
jgi:hypothetical protein